MASEFFQLIAIIILFSLVQSIFGVGILLFGTPTLLLMGYSYSEALCIVLPSSLSVSIAQVFSCNHLVQSKRDVYLLMLPPVLLGLFFILKFEEPLGVTNIVGAGLVVIGALRLSMKAKSFLVRFIGDNYIPAYFFTGLVHGLSNMGGGILSFLIPSIYKDKIAIRANIAFAYCWFGIIQLFVLAMFKIESFKYFYIVLPLISFLVYFLFNKILMDRVNGEKFHKFISIIIIFYGIIALL